MNRALSLSTAAVVSLLGLLVPMLGQVHASNIAGEKSYLKVLFPADLKKNDDFMHSEALFGIPQYGTGRKLIGELAYMTYKDDDTGCGDYDYNPPKSGEPLIFLVDRGDCSFVQKVRIAQQRGASAVIIADNVCQCENANAQAEPKGRTQAFKNKCIELGNVAQQSGRLIGSVCDFSLPFMADDGTGNDIYIPSFLIDYYDAQKFKDCFLTANQNLADNSYQSMTGYTCAPGTKILASMEWSLPAPDNNVEYDIWTSSDSEAKFKRDFVEIAKVLKDSTTFTPHYFIWDGTRWGCTAATAPCKTQCTDGGYYCNPDPDKDLFAGVSGKDIVEENLRQLCVWKQAEPNLRKDAGELWWRYAIAFADKCHPNETPTPDKFNIKCSEDVHNSIQGLSWAKTKACVDSSWDAGKTKNKLLDGEIAARTLKNILQLPTLVVNNVTIRGGVNSASVLSAICNGFEKGTEPQSCECVNKAPPGKLQECISSLCTAGSKYCYLDSHCYPENEFTYKCTNACPKGFVFCKSQLLCKPTIEDCQACIDPTKPFYCSAKKACVATLEGCNDGISVGMLVAILCIVIFLLGVVFVLYWKRQRVKMQEEVRSILSEYMPLEEVNSRGGVGLTSSAVPSRPLNQVASNNGDSQGDGIEISRNNERDEKALGLA